MAARLAASDAKLAAADKADRAALASFYEARRHQPLWIEATGLSARGKSVVDEIGRADDWGLEAAAFQLPKVGQAGAELAPTDQAEADIGISLAVLKYARYARGGRANPLSLSRNLDRQLHLVEPSEVLQQIAGAAAPDAYLRALHPQHPQFERLRQKYLALHRGQAPEQSEPADARHKKHSAAANNDGLMRKLLVNMEEWRWMPESLGDFYVWVNVPEFTLRVVKNGKVIHTERVVVGKPDKQTPIFSDAMEQVIFNPFWGVPDSIKKEEILPSLARGSTSILQRHNLRIQYRGRDIDPEGVDWASADMRQFHVYQPPGDGNVLGIVKFRFPNKHDVYMHDTPTKNLFNASVRAFSHGCMRVRDPIKLAELLLAQDKGWPASRTVSAARSGRQDNQINLAHRFPVHITYFTAMVDDDGKLKTFGDIYGHEHRIALGMEGKAYLISHAQEKSPARAEAVGHLAETSGGGRRKDWAKHVFDN